MKKIFSLIPLALLSSSMSANAFIGGPFDNGDYGVLMERGGYYQSSYSFKNGSGYALWSPDNLQGAVVNGQTVTNNIGSGSLFTPSTGNANRTVLYYKGVTYFGGAFGEIDMASKRISGYGNASSEFSATVNTQQTQNNLFFGQTNVSQTNSSNVVTSGRSYVANVNWGGKVTASHPQLRFTGKGEISIISPNGQAAVASLAYDAYSQLLSAISQSVQASGSSIFGVSPGLYADAQVAISNALNGNPGTSAIPASITPAYNFAQAVGSTGTPVDVNRDGIFNNDLVAVSNNPQNTIQTAAQAAVPGSAGLSSYLEGTGPTESYDQSENFKIKVRGYRRFF